MLYVIKSVTRVLLQLRSILEERHFGLWPFAELKISNHDLVEQKAPSSTNYNIQITIYFLGIYKGPMRWESRNPFTQSTNLVDWFLSVFFVKCTNSTVFRKDKKSACLRLKSHFVSQETSAILFIRIQTESNLLFKIFANFFVSCSH